MRNSWRTAVAVAALRAASRATMLLSINQLRRVGAEGDDLAYRLDARAACTTRASIALVYADRLGNAA